MNAEVFGILAGAGAAALAAWGTWAATRRKTSGDIDTSEAVTLWTESTTIRNELRVEITKLREQLDNATNSIQEVIEQLRLSNEATNKAREETLHAREEILALRADIAKVHAEVSTGNALTIGELVDNAESRRIAAIPEQERTPTEADHIDTVGDEVQE